MMIRETHYDTVKTEKKPLGKAGTRKTLLRQTLSVNVNLLGPQLLLLFVQINTNILFS